MNFIKGRKVLSSEEGMDSGIYDGINRSGTGMLCRKGLTKR